MISPRSCTASFTTSTITLLILDACIAIHTRKLRCIKSSVKYYIIRPTSILMIQAHGSLRHGLIKITTKTIMFSLILTQMVPLETACTHGLPVSYDGILDEFRAIASMPWFSRAAVQENAENDFEQLALYSWDDKSYWDVEAEELSSRVWKDIVAFDVDYSSYYGSVNRNELATWPMLQKAVWNLRSGR